MKKFFSLILAVAMLLSCVAFAEDVHPIFSADPEEVMLFNREIHLNDWLGNYTLVAAYVGEDFIEEWELEGVTAGFKAVPAGAITVTIASALDRTANDPSGALVDTANYYHAHVYDLFGSTLTIGEDVYTMSNEWDEWPNTVVRGEQDGDFNLGPARVHIKGEDETLNWAELTGVEIEDMEDFKYIGISKAGYLILCYADKNAAKKDEPIGYAYIFEAVAE